MTRPCVVAGAAAIVIAAVAVVLLVSRGRAHGYRKYARTDTLPPAPAVRGAATRAGIELGRKLFFDPRLSANDRISCATCHAPERAFSDGVALSTRGMTGAMLTRNSPGLANIAWVEQLFWDGGSKNLESLVFGPIQHPDEMGESVERMVAQLGADPEMRDAFARAFRGEGVTPNGVMRALAQYLRSLVSSDSRYDRHLRGEPDQLGEAEVRGLEIVRARCAGCHATSLFTDRGFHNTGLDAARPLPDEDPRRGRARVTFRAADERAFRTPSLRNLSYTAPYMHDGRFATLEQVLDHYRRGVIRSPALDPLLVDGIALTDDEAADVIAFLRALDDDDFVARHSAAR